MSSSTSSLLVIASSHDLPAESEVDSSSSSSSSIEQDGHGLNKPIHRKRLILSSLQSTSSCTFLLLSSPPSLFDLSLASCVHSPSFLTFLSAAYSSWSKFVSSRQADLYMAMNGIRTSGDVSQFVPGQIASRWDECQLPGNNVHSQICYYATDRMTPIVESTELTLRCDLSVIQKGVEAITSGKHKEVYCLTTQPGHHAGKESYGGYCFVNNAAVAASLLHKYYSSLSSSSSSPSSSPVRVGVLDVDYHSGNGTSSIFYKSSSVFVASIHMDVELDYPYNCGFASQTGSGEGEGYTLNIPMPSGANWNEHYRPALARAIEALRKVQICALVVSLGVDTVENDPECAPLAGMKLKSEDYRNMGTMIRELGVPLVFVQEGGYRLEVAAEMVRNVLLPKWKQDEKK